MVALKAEYVSPEEYLAREREAETKSEYIAGEVVAMAGATRAHQLLAANTLISLGTQLKGRRCEVSGSDTRVQVPGANAFTYPDVVVACGDIEMLDERQDTLLNPTVIIEVLSPSTEAYDRGAKFFYYRQLESLMDYLLISQDAMRVEHYTRQPNGLWLLSEAMGPDGVVEIASIGCTLRLADVYEKVNAGRSTPGASME